MKPSGWKPRCALRVGVVGNRRLHGLEDAAAQASRDVWKTLIDSIGVVLGERHRGVCIADLFDGTTPRLAVLSSLAAGADQIGAQAAFNAAGARTDIDIELEAPLPFGENDYPGLPDEPRQEFTGDEAEELRRLAAKATQVVRFDGDYSTEEGRRAAYRHARDLVLQNSDILIAIYDPDEPGSEAGTRETVKLALESNSPVIAVHLGRAGATIAIARSVEHWHRHQNWKPIVEQCVREQLVLSELLQDHDDAKLHHALDGLRRVANPKAAPWLCRNRIFASIFDWTWRLLRSMTSVVASTEAKETRRKAEGLPKPNDDITLEPYKSLYDPASELAFEYMRTYRGAFVLSYFLAGLAVAAAVTMMFVIIVTELHPPLWAAVTLCLTKILILATLLALERSGRRLRLHESAVDFRYVAELLRPMQWLCRAGVYPPAVDLPLHSASDDLRRSWMAWLVRAAARSSPSVSAGPDHPREIAMTRARAAEVLDEARAEWVAGQIRYHAINNARMEAMGEGLERWAKTLLWVVLGAAGFTLALEWMECAELLARVLGALAAVLPAFIAALIGVAFQSEAKRLAKRSETMKDALAQQQKQLTDLAESLRSGQASHAGATAILKKLSSITIVEAADWKILYQVHEIRAS